MKLQLRPIDFKEAAAFVRKHHRHHTPPIGHKFSVAAWDGDQMVGVVIVGRPVSRMRDDGMTLEITRLCVDPAEPPVVDKKGKTHAPAACSFLYGAAARACFALGYRRIGTYILEREPGTSLIAARYVCKGQAGGGSWSREGRERDDKHPLEPKLLFERTSDG